MSATVCLVSPGHVASNPRLVKEADALCAAGFRVRVVAADYWPAFRRLDNAVLAGAPWEIQKVYLGEGWGRWLRALRRRVCGWLIDRGLIPYLRTALWAESDLVSRLADAAAEKHADLYIGRYLPGLAAAAHAARVHRSKLGFDAEDSHVDELDEGPAWSGRRKGRALIERAFLPLCLHLTAASPGIADALRHRYGVRADVVLNVFPQKEAPPAPEQTAHQRGNGPPSLYWFSQTIGPGRGLEAVIEAVGRMRLPAHLHLRGVCSQGYQNTLEALAGRIGMKDRLHLHPPASPEQMAVLAAGHDLGLALELNQPPNRALCLTNKIFTYLLAGIPVLLSRTPAQERLAPELGPAAILVNLADPGALAVRLDAFFADAEQQRSARSCAWQLGQERFNWDVEQRTFLGSVRRALGMKVDESPGDR